MARIEQIDEFAYSQVDCEFFNEDLYEGIIIGAKWADETMIEMARKLVKNAFFGSFGKDLANNIEDEFVKEMKGEGFLPTETLKRIGGLKIKKL